MIEVVWLPLCIFLPEVDFSPQFYNPFLFPASRPVCKNEKAWAHDLELHGLNQFSPEDRTLTMETRREIFFFTKTWFYKLLFFSPVNSFIHTCPMFGLLKPQKVNNNGIIILIICDNLFRWVYLKFWCCGQNFIKDCLGLIRSSIRVSEVNVYGWLLFKK